MFEKTVWWSHMPLYTQRGSPSAPLHFESPSHVHLRIRVGLAAIFVRQTGLHPGDQAIGAGHLSAALLKVLHAVMLTHWRGGEGPVADHDSLGVVLRKE